jgi:hypothetical protein
LSTTRNSPRENLRNHNNASCLEGLGKVPRMSGGLIVVFRRLRTDELRTLQRRRPQILIVCVVPAGELAAWEQEFLLEISESDNE